MLKCVCLSVEVINFKRVSHSDRIFIGLLFRLVKPRHRGQDERCTLDNEYLYSDTILINCKVGSRI